MDTLQVRQSGPTAPAGQPGQTYGYNPVAAHIAQILVEGFDRHYRLFRQTSQAAKARFEAGNWQEEIVAVRERIQFYDDRVRETMDQLRSEFNTESIDDNTWQQAKLLFIGLLLNHKQPELAETFFNSVYCHILHRAYFHNDYIFTRPALSTEYITSDPPVYSTYYPQKDGLRETIKRIILDFDWQCPFVDLDDDVRQIWESACVSLGGAFPEMEANCQIQVLHSAFYRNKAAYIFGKVLNGWQEYPFAVPILRTESGQLYVDTVLLDIWRISILFSLSRAYFMVDMEVPSGYAAFLRSIVPNKSWAELYTMLGLGKQGKTTFFRDLIAHLHHSRDNFIIAPGIRGLVMLVFTLPSFPFVFKIIKDVFGSTKEVDHATVKYKYQLVKQVDRVGRMADTLEFSNVALPRARFSQELIDELYQLAPSLLEEDGDDIVIQHLYIERRMEPLNIYLERMNREGREDMLEAAVKDYGAAIRELAIANIFPGDMLWKNFGMTRYGRVVFYDYDEIEYMTDCNFRQIPPAPYPEMEMASEPWYSAARNDIFPEEFATFLLGSPQVRKAFLKHHRDLLDVKFWQDAQQKIRAGQILDFFPYPETMRFQRE